MPTPFNDFGGAGSKGKGEPTATRSVFKNYSAEAPSSGPLADPSESPQKQAGSSRAPLTPPAPDLEQASIDAAMARAFIYRFLAKAFEYPSEEGWAWLSGSEIQAAFAAAIRALASNKGGPLNGCAEELVSQVSPSQFESFASDYLAAFGHAARGSCPLNEIDYGELKADPLFQPHRLADLAAFYRAFGLEITEDAAERHDHICIELEFMSVLAAKEAYALHHRSDREALTLCREAQKNFLREHIGRWAPAFTRRLARMVGEGGLSALANLACAFIEADCQLFGVTPGSEDLGLRPVDETSESLCASCGISNLPPGALPSSA